MTLKMTHAMRMELADAIRDRYAAAATKDKSRTFEEFIAATHGGEIRPTFSIEARPLYLRSLQNRSKQAVTANVLRNEPMEVPSLNGLARCKT